MNKLDIRKNLKLGMSNPLPSQKTVHSGWMWKRGKLSELTNRRWFEIKGDQLYYFKSKDDYATVLGQIPLAGNEIKKPAALVDTSGKYVFELIAGKERAGRPVMDKHDSLLFGTSTPYDMEEWIKAINRIIYTPSGGGMFGRSLTETIKIDSRRGGGMVPIIVERCVEYLKIAGMSEEGIFRVPGLKDDVESLKNAFNKGEIIDFGVNDYKVHIVASVLKQYIGDLPESVIPPAYYDEFIAVGIGCTNDKETAIEKFTNLLKIIPIANYNLLKYLCCFLYLLQACKESTKMSISNLALIFGPNILRPQTDDPGLLLKSLSDVNVTTMSLITYQEQLFPITGNETYYHPADPTEIVYDISPSGHSSDYRKNAEFSYKVPRVLSTMRRSLSVGNLFNFMDSETPIYVGRNYYDWTSHLKNELAEQRTQFQDQIRELENKLETELKIREMIKIRLMDEHKARVAAEDRLETYHIGIEEFCKKFGQADISIS